MKRVRLVTSLLRYLGERVPLEKLDFESLVSTKQVPVHRMSWAYYLGGLALFFFAVQVVTGILLLFYYEGTVSDANASVDFLTRRVVGGALIHNIHTWSASFMVFCVIAHLITVFAMRAYERPREITWWTGIVLLFVTFAFGFTGYLLPWNQLAVNATKVGLQSFEAAGKYLPGPMSEWPTRLRVIIQGGPAVGEATLSRFFAAHVVVLPMIVFAVLSLHILLVQLHGMSPGVTKPTGRSERFFPFYVLRDFSLWGIAFLALFVLGICLPFESFSPYPLFEPYDPLGSTPEGIKPEWYFYFIYYPLELLPFWLVALALSIVVAGLLVTPWVFSRTSRTTLGAVAIVATLYLVTITVFGGHIYHLVKGPK